MGVPRFSDCHMYYYTGAVDGLQAEKGDSLKNFIFFIRWAGFAHYLA